MGKIQMNGNLLNWVKWIVALVLILLGWAYTLGVQGEKIKSNCADDAIVHPKVSALSERVTRVETTLESAQKDILNNQRLIMRRLGVETNRGEP